MKYLTIILLFLLPVRTLAVEGEIDVSEVIRRGNFVEHININRQHISDVDSDGISQVMQMPADDSDKWYVSIVGIKDCPACLSLKSDWTNDINLQSIAIPGDGENSWAHLNYYQYEDTSQSWRWKDIEFSGFPAIIVQPPRNEQFGPVKDIVFFQSGYGGDPEILARKMLDAIKLRITKFPPTSPIRGPPQEAVIGVDPPWDTNPQSDPNRPLRPFRVPDTPPKESPVPFPGWSIPAIFAGGPFMWIALGGLAFWGFTRVRQWRVDQGKKPVIDDSTMEFLINLAKQFDLVQEEDEVEPPPVIKKVTPRKKRIVRRKTK